MDRDGEALATLVDWLQDGLMRKTSGGLRRLPDRWESWGFLGTRTDKIIAQLAVARAAVTAESATFLDCGCGLGVVAFLAHQFGFRAAGVEIAPEYVELARHFFAPPVQIEEGDLCTFDRFADFDVVYYFAPFADADKQIEFELRLEAAVRPGAVILAHAKKSDEWRTSGRFEEVGRDVEGERWWAFQKKFGSV
jgi:SAM-dependent methyltransferase